MTVNAGVSYPPYFLLRMADKIIGKQQVVLFMFTERLLDGLTDDPFSAITNNASKRPFVTAS
jgi:hypothetical protein